MEALNVLFWVTCALVLTFHSLVGLWNADSDPTRDGIIMKADPVPSGNHITRDIFSRGEVAYNRTAALNQTEVSWHLNYWRNCGSSASTLAVRNLSLVDGSTSSLHVTWQSEKHVNFTTPIMGLVTVHRMVSSDFWLPMPCSLDHGSCNHSDICVLLWTPCPKVWRQPRSSLTIGEKGEMKFAIPVGNRGSAVPFWLGLAGDFRFRIDVMDHESKASLLCLEVELSSSTMIKHL